MSAWTRCPKCKATSGDDWSQCNGECPMSGPHFSQKCADKYKPKEAPTKRLPQDSRGWDPNRDPP